jgi:hypothetical protein
VTDPPPVLSDEDIAALEAAGVDDLAYPDDAGYDGSANYAAVPVSPTDQIYIYPGNGQSLEQQARDEYECHEWASQQSGYDPSQLAAALAQGNPAVYRQSMIACLEARGYGAR